MMLGPSKVQLLNSRAKVSDGTLLGPRIIWENGVRKSKSGIKFLKSGIELRIRGIKTNSELEFNS